MRARLCYALLASAPAAQQQAFEAYYDYLVDYPADSNPGFHEDVQGVTHDATHWYFTQAVEGDTQNQAIWRIPVFHDLASVVAGVGGVTRLALNDIPGYAEAGLWHAGDPSTYFHAESGKTFLVVPFEFGQPCHRIAFFDAPALAFLDDIELCTPGTSDKLQADASWVGVDPQGVLWSSAFDASTLHRYTVDWDALATGQDLTFSHEPTETTLWNGGSPASLSGIQGGCFSPSGELLFLVAGGIHVFETLTWTKVQSSTNGFGLFDFEFDPSLLESEEPEGLTIWDVDGLGAPGSSGQLHVLLLDNDLSADEIYFKHYTNVVRVQPWNPFGLQTVNAAIAYAWDGTELVPDHGSYAESMVIDKRVLLRAEAGGTVVIGE